MNVDPTITFGGIGLLLAIATLALSLFVALRSMRRENKADAATAAERSEKASKEASEELKKLFHGRSDELRDQMREIQIGLGERVSKLEGTATAFVPRGEIEAKFDHEKNNRLAQGEAISRRLDRQDGDITELKVRVGGLAQRQDGHDQQMTELKAIVREGFDKASEKIDRLADTIRGGKQ